MLPAISHSFAFFPSTFFTFLLHSFILFLIFLFWHFTLRISAQRKEISGGGARRTASNHARQELYAAEEPEEVAELDDFMADNEQLSFGDGDGDAMEETEAGLWPPEAPAAAEDLLLTAVEARPSSASPSGRRPNQQLTAKAMTAGQKSPNGQTLSLAANWPPTRLTTATPVSRPGLELPYQEKHGPKSHKPAQTAPLGVGGIDFGALSGFGSFPQDFPKFDSVQGEATTKASVDEASEGRRLTPFGMTGYYVEAGRQDIRVPDDGSSNDLISYGEQALSHGHTYTHDHQHTHKSDHTHGHKHAHEHKATHGHEHKHGHTHANDHKHSHAHGHKHGHDHKHGHSHREDHKHAHSHAADHKHDHKHDHKAGHKHLHQHQHENKHAHAHTGEHKHHHHHEHHHHHHHKHTHAAEHKHGHTHNHAHKGHY
jgi:hypothetical protein